MYAIPSNPMENLLTVDQLSEYLQISKRTVYDWVHVGYVPCYKFPKGVRFKVIDVERWLKKRKRGGRSIYQKEI